MVSYNSSIRYYLRYYRLVAVAVIVMMAVLSGSLLLGDSVRGTLQRRVTERLGQTETLVTSGTGFMEEDILRHPFYADARGYLICEGYVSAGNKLLPVMVWATDADSIARGEAIVNAPLHQKLGADEDLVLHLPSHSLVPSGTLFVTERYSTQLRLKISKVRSVEEGGNLLLRNEQTLPLNVFLNRQELAEAMELEGKLNLIMSPRMLSQEEIDQTWDPALSGIHVDGNRITSDRIFLQPAVVEQIHPERTCMAYLVNTLKGEADTLWYSFVTATDNWGGQALQGNEVLLSDYAAERLGVQVGDSLSMDYFITKGMKSLEERSHSFIVKAILPLEEIQRDSLLTTEFPGLSNVERCADWDSDLPIDMDRITKEDEDFWYAHHQTPKAIVSYEAVVDDWGTTFGKATGLQDRQALEKISRLAPRHFGIQTVWPQAAGRYAATHGTDFSSLFLALGFFIILSGILLMQNPLVEMLNRRQPEIQLYRTLGYTRRRIYGLLLREAGTVILVASPLGILGGLLYSGVTLFLLGNVWSGATHTEGFSLYVSPWTLLLAWLTGLLICLLTLYWAIRSCLREKNGKEKQTVTPSRYLLLTWLTAIPCLVGLLANLFLLHSIILFVLCGLLWILTGGFYLIYFITRKAQGQTGFSHDSLCWTQLAAQRSNVILSYFALAVGVFTVFAVGLNRPDFSQWGSDATATGGYDLWCEYSVPIQYDLNQEAVRQKLHLEDLPADVRFMQIQKHTRDEASCLNLNKVSTPTVYGVDPAQLQASFGVSTQSGGLLIDQESLIWSLMKSVGDTVRYNDGNGKSVSLPILADYPTGIFHGNALIDNELFRQLWPEETGSSILLVKTGEARRQEVRELLENVLSEYGIRICTTEDRIRLFFTVTDTYLTIFLTLGGLGILLGIFSLIIVVRKNLASRRDERQLLLTLGYRGPDIRRLYIRENTIVPLYAVLSGSIGSLISISANVSGAGWGTMLTALIFLAAILYTVVWGIRRIIPDP